MLAMKTLCKGLPPYDVRDLHQYLGITCNSTPGQQVC
jgi:hypothetical protein